MSQAEVLQVVPVEMVRVAEPVGQVGKPEGHILGNQKVVMVGLVEQGEVVVSPV
jgi:hypothetical protein